MATPTIALPFGIRARTGSPGRHLPSPPTQFVIQTLARADAALAEPFVGITTDGQVEPGLFIALDNDEPARTHIHTVMRTPNGNDYGKDLLRQHYARFPH